jgi:hypothetical protein
MTRYQVASFDITRFAPTHPAINIAIQNSSKLCLLPFLCCVAWLNVALACKIPSSLYRFHILSAPVLLYLLPSSCLFFARLRAATHQLRQDKYQDMRQNRQKLTSTSWLRPVCGGFCNLISFNCAPFFASCRRHRVLTVTCLDACRCAAYLTLQPRSWNQYIAWNFEFNFIGIHGVITQRIEEFYLLDMTPCNSETELFIITSLRTSHPTQTKEIFLYMFLCIREILNLFQIESKDLSLVPV